MHQLKALIEFLSFIYSFKATAAAVAAKSAEKSAEASAGAAAGKVEAGKGLDSVAEDLAGIQKEIVLLHNAQVGRWVGG